MKFFWIIIAVALGAVTTILNDVIPLSSLQALTAGTPSPPTNAGDGYYSDDDGYDDFPTTLLDDDSWGNLRCKGENLAKAMRSSNAEAGKLWSPLLPSAESQWDDFHDLAGWYWHQETSPEEIKVNFLDDRPGSPGLGLGPALDALGLPSMQSEDPNAGIQIIYVAHADYSLSQLPHNDPRYASVNDQAYNAGAAYRATGGYYKFGINTSIGAIFGLDRLAPEKAAEERTPPIGRDGLPALQRYSDVAWLFWAEQAASKNQLKYFVTVAITNEQTQCAIRRALKNVNKEYGPWPGTTFSTDTDEGKVLLGSPNGRAHGYFLAQHKSQLGGNMYISRIQVFHGETEPFIPNMVLHVEQPKPTTVRLGTKKPAKKRGLQRKNAKL
ncbi:hypothetical protein EKO04_009605 [Ascochyta lentis]|uniref:Uncharacterized protein n=1 Tax=Ascochyta lentis TaxID=205686 RepID=A0A8H7IY86_9PLEO|nr:hypothetical protein EKO04_009605 [Ascochyta lentis]